MFKEMHPLTIGILLGIALVVLILGLSLVVNLIFGDVTLVWDWHRWFPFIN